MFCISGLWHGANWTFLIWGAIHGFIRLVEDGIRSFVPPVDFRNSFLNKLKNVVKIIFTFSIVCFTWIFFRSNSLKDAMYIIKNMFLNINFSSFLGNLYEIINTTMLDSHYFRYFYVISIIVIVVIIFLMDLYKAYVLRNDNIAVLFNNINTLSRWCLYWFLSVSTILYFILERGIFGQTGEFIYFRF